jgi:hypothetical protein
MVRLHVREDRGDIVMGWLTRLVVGLALVAVIGFDAVTVGMATVSTQDQANSAAVAARDAYAERHDVHAALLAAQSEARTANDANIVVPGSLVVARDGSVTLRLERPIHTMVARYLPIDQFKTATSDGKALETP